MTDEDDATEAAGRLAALRAGTAVHVPFKEPDDVVTR